MPDHVVPTVTDAVPGPGALATAEPPLADQVSEAGAPVGPPPSLHPGPERSFVRRHRTWLIIGGVVVLAGAGVGIWLGTSSASSTNGFTTTVKTVVVSVSTGTIKKTVAASGTVDPAQTSDLNFAVSGTVTAVNAAAGQTVTAGEVLATVAPTALAAEESAAQAALTAANSKLDEDEDDDASTSQIASDKASVTSAKDALTTAEKSVADANLTSPIAGVVASVDVTVGEQVAGSGGHGGGATADAGSGSSDQFVVVSSDTYVVDCTVDDTEVGSVAVGDQATITPTGATTPVYGTVASVAQVASGSGTVASFPVVIDVTGSPKGIYAGASATVSIIVKKLSDVVEVPAAALNDNGSQPTVTLVQGDKHVTQAVTTGTTTATTNETQITKGLTSGQKIIEREVTFSGTPGGARTRGGTGTFGKGFTRTGTAGGGGGGFPVRGFSTSGTGG